MLEKIIAIVAEQLGVNEDSLSEETSFKDDLDADSLDLYELIMAVEEEYGVEFPNEELENLATIGDVATYLKSRGIG